MTELGRLEQAILLRLVDRLVRVERQTATNLATVGALTESDADPRHQIIGRAATSHLARQVKINAATLQEKRRPGGDGTIRPGTPH